MVNTTDCADTGAFVVVTPLDRAGQLMVARTLPLELILMAMVGLTIPSTVTLTWKEPEPVGVTIPSLLIVAGPETIVQNAEPGETATVALLASFAVKVSWVVPVSGM